MNMQNKQTKIVATISDINCEVELIQELFENGMNIARLNTAHQTPEDTLRVVKNIRAVSDQIAIIVDTKGPEVRTQNVDTPLYVQPGDEIFIGEYHGTGKHYQVNYEHFVHEVPVHARILINDGSVGMTVTEKKETYLVCRIENSGKIGNRKSVNVPGIHLNVPLLTEKDRAYIQFCAEHDIDFIAHSFVRNKKDVQDIQDMLDAAQSRVKIIAKIENRKGVENIHEILEHVFGIMIARGDLGVEIPGEEVPIVQKKIIHLCMRRAKPVITATQMLHSMTENPAPTRAEISDVANAIFDGTDAIMLSSETTHGKYPVEAVKTMARIAHTVEREKPKLTDLPVFQDKKVVRNYLAKCAVSAALELPVKAIIVDTSTGFSSRIVAAYRGHIPIYTKCHDRRVVRELMLSYGIYPSFMEMPPSTDELVGRSLTALVHENKVALNDLVVVLAGVPGHQSGSDFLEINTVEMCISGKRRTAAPAE